jgi:hypothetical protein
MEEIVMQIYPMNFIYAALCLVLIPISVLGGAYVDYYLGIWWVSLIISLLPVCFVCAAVTFFISAVNVEVWDDCYRRL